MSTPPTPTNPSTKVLAAILTALSVAQGAGTFALTSAGSSRLEEKVDKLIARFERNEGAKLGDRFEKLEERVRDLEIAHAARDKR